MSTLLARHLPKSVGSIMIHIYPQSIGNIFSYITTCRQVLIALYNISTSSSLGLQLANDRDRKNSIDNSSTNQYSLIWWHDTIMMIATMSVSIWSIYTKALTEFPNLVQFGIRNCSLLVTQAWPAGWIHKLGVGFWFDTAKMTRCLIILYRQFGLQANDMEDIYFSFPF